MVGMKMGALIGAALDGADGEDSVLDGTIKGALIGGLLRVVIPVAVTYATGWFVLRGLEEARTRIFGTMKEAH